VHPRARRTWRSTRLASDPAQCWQYWAVCGGLPVSLLGQGTFAAMTEEMIPYAELNALLMTAIPESTG